MTTHTPEPWTTDLRIDSFHNRGFISVHTSTRSIARVTCYGVRDHGNAVYSQPEVDEARANARLIVASPVLLRELRWLVEAVFSTGISEAEAHRITMSAGAALARATGSPGPRHAGVVLDKPAVQEDAP
jgi:hypothetical protein